MNMMTRLLFSLTILSIISCTENDNVVPENYIDIKATNNQYKFVVRPIDTPSTYYIGDNIDQLSVVMTTEDKMRCEIHLSLTDLLNKSFPYSIPKESDDGYGEIQIINENETVDATFGDNDNINFLGHTYQGLTIEIKDFKNNILTGKIIGPIRTKTGIEEIIETGEFRLLVALEETN